MDVREKILQSEDRPRERVDVPEWGVAVYVRTVGADERDLFETRSLVKRGKRSVFDATNFRARMCVLCCEDEDGKSLFQEGDAPRLAKKSSRAVARVADVAMRLNGWTEEDVEEMSGN